VIGSWCVRQDVVEYGSVQLELSAVEQLVHTSQTRFIAEALQHLSRTMGSATVAYVQQHSMAC